MSDNPKVSVITPIYNVARYLSQCLKSLKAQTLKEIEFICINDGSEDESLSILREHAQGDDRFVIIDKANSGYGATMNRGLQAARGEYIGIVEPDDFIDAGAFEYLYEVAVLSGKPDLVKANHYCYNDRSGDRFFENFPEELCGKVLSPIEEPGINTINTTPAIWAAIYRADFINANRIGFLETPGASFQDTGFVVKSWLACDAFVLVHDAFLHYRADNVTSSVKDPSKIFFVCDELASIEGFLAERPEREKVLLPYVIAKKCATYKWNLKRIDASFKPSFLERYRSELLEARDAGLLDESLYSPEDWKQVTRVLDSFDSVMAECQLEERAKRDVKISVIVPVHNGMPHLNRTLSFLKRQTFDKIEVLIVNDGSTDASQECIDSYCVRDARFKSFYQEHQGAAAARNVALEHASGEYIAFCDAGDFVPIGSYEVMYRAAMIQDADVVVGLEDEFTLSSETVHKGSERLSRRKRFDKFDCDLNRDLSVHNKLFRASIVKEHGLRFRDTSPASGDDGVFLFGYLAYARNLAGCPDNVYRCRKHHFFEPKGAMRRVDLESITDYFNRMSEVKRLRGVCANHDIDLYGQTDAGELAIQGVQAKAVFVSEDVDNTALSDAIERYYRQMWRLDAESLDYLKGQLAIMRDERVYPEHWKDICARNADLFLEEGFKTHDEFSEHVLVSIIITPQELKSDFIRLLNSTLSQNFPAIEIFVPSTCWRWTPKRLRALPNVHQVKAETRRDMMNRSLKKAKGRYINILEDRIFHTQDSLRDMWKTLDGSRADFLCASLAGITKRRKPLELKIVPQLYAPEFAETLSIRSRFLVLDSSPNNKLFKREALLKLPPFSKSPTLDAKRAFSTLSFKKAPKITLACFEDDAFFLDRVSERMQMAFDAFLLWRDKHPFEHREEKSPTAWKVRNQIMFCSNREDNRLSASMQRVYDALPEVHKVVFSEPLPHSVEYLARLKRAIVQSKVIVTDDYIHELKDIELSENQSVIQLWHACGAFKKFGLDNMIYDMRRERAKHRQYDAIMVSDESVRSVYARAFGVREDVVKALGVPRTDALLDEVALQSTRSRVYERYPELSDKTLILYCPTFREKGGRQEKWCPEIDWGALDATLSDDQVLIVKPHPMEISQIIPQGRFSHIRTDVDASSDELMVVAGLLVTDCSSIVFDYSLLEKPIVFYFPDIDTFNRDYYIDFPEGFGVSVVMQPDELAPSIQEALSNPERHLISGIRNGMMGACDGHSTERIAAYIMERFER